MQPHLSWDLVEDVRQMLAFPFMVNALRAGTLVAVVAGAIGWVMVLRRQSFAGHTLAVVGFPGAAAAIWLGVATGWGYYGACIASALVIAALPPSARRGGLGGFGEESALIGTVQAFALACGFLFVSLYHGFLSGLTNLLVFALLVTPAATAHRLTARPALGVGLSVGFALVASWVGMTVAFYSPYPIGFWVTTVTFAGYLLATGWRLAADRVGQRRRPGSAVASAAARGMPA